MAQNPIDGGAYYQDADGALHKLDSSDYQLDPVTRLLVPPKRLTLNPKPPDSPAAPLPTAKK
jgi:hypothetical protein